MLREFTDNSGQHWRVWDVYPSERGKGGPSEREIVAAELRGRFRSAELAEGWLCFESATERRRLAPIPPDWEVVDPAILAQLLARAGYVSARTSDPTGQPVPTGVPESRSDAQS
jgi:hypothetical protein